MCVEVAFTIREPASGVHERTPVIVEPRNRLRSGQPVEGILACPLVIGDPVAALLCSIPYALQESFYNVVGQAGWMDQRSQGVKLYAYARHRATKNVGHPRQEAYAKRLDWSVGFGDRGLVCA